MKNVKPIVASTCKGQLTGFKSLTDGQKVFLTVTQGQRGLQAEQVRAIQGSLPGLKEPGLMHGFCFKRTCSAQHSWHGGRIR